MLVRPARACRAEGADTGLDIRIVAPSSAPEAELTLCLEDDGYYWALRPSFDRIHAQCGKLVDLYGDARFTRDDYPRLRRMLEDADATARRQPRVWEVQVGTQLVPTRVKLYRSVHRDTLLEIIAKLRRMVDVADRLGGVIECSGD